MVGKSGAVKDNEMVLKSSCACNTEPTELLKRLSVRGT